MTSPALSLQCPWFFALGAWICGLLHQQGNLKPARAIPAPAAPARGAADRHELPLPPLRPPGPLRFNVSKGGLSSISVGGRGASFNIPVNRAGGPRTTPRIAPPQSLLAVLRQELFAPGSAGEHLWAHGLVSRLLSGGALSAEAMACWH